VEDRKVVRAAGLQDYWLITTGDKQEAGIDGGLMKRSSPGATTVNTIEVKSVDEIVKRVEESGGRTAAPKMAVPGIGYLAYLIDTEGIVFGVMETDPKAK
jgi:uncharacterized protein